MTVLQVSDQDLANTDVKDITAQQVEVLAKRLEQDAYESPFESLQDWHLLRSIAFQRPELVQEYLHLLDIEPFDEA
ncbi:MAG: DUF2555 domain-containing protein [Cyanobacteria bacterium P01_A01_bin.105]